MRAWRRLSDFLTLNDIRRDLAELRKESAVAYKNLEAISEDWPLLRDAVVSKLAEKDADIASKADQIADLSSQLKALDADDAKAGEIDSQIKDLIASLKETSAAPVISETPPVAPDAGAGAAPADPAAISTQPPQVGDTNVGQPGEASDGPVVAEAASPAAQASPAAPAAPETPVAPTT